MSRGAVEVMFPPFEDKKLRFFCVKSDTVVRPARLAAAFIDKPLGVLALCLAHILVMVAFASNAAGDDHNKPNAAFDISRDIFVAAISSKDELRAYSRQYSGELSFSLYLSLLRDLNKGRSTSIVLDEDWDSLPAPVFLILPTRKNELLENLPKVDGGGVTEYSVDRRSLNELAHTLATEAARGDLDYERAGLSAIPNGDLDKPSGPHDRETHSNMVGEGQQSSYVVQYADTLWSIAKTYRISLEKLMSLNGISNPSALREGQTLALTESSLIAGNTEGRISVEKLESNSTANFHQVRFGDTLFGIALEAGLPVERIAALNGIDPPYHIRVGDAILLSTDERSSPFSKSPLSVVHPGVVEDVAITKGQDKLGTQIIEPKGDRSHSRHRHFLVPGAQLGSFCVEDEANISDLGLIEQTLSDLIGSQHDIYEAERALLEVLPEIGFKDVATDIPELQNRLYVTIGSLYRSRAIRIEPTETLFTQGQLQGGELVIEDGLSLISRKDVELVAGDWLLNQGYSDAKIDSVDEEINRANKTIDYVVRYKAEGKSYIAATEFVGKPVFTDDHLRKLAPELDTNILDGNYLDTLKERLLDTGYLSVVEFDLIDLESDVSNAKKLLIKANPKEKNRLSGSFYVDDIGRPGAIIDFSLPNFTLREDDVTIRGKSDTRTTELMAAYKRNNLFYYGHDLLVTAMYGREAHPYYQNKRSSISVESVWDYFDGMSIEVGLSYLENEESTKYSTFVSGHDYARFSVGLRGGTRFFDRLGVNWNADVSINQALSSSTQSYIDYRADAVANFEGSRYLNTTARSGFVYRSFGDSEGQRAAVSELYNGGIGNNRGYRFASATSSQWPDSRAISQSYLQLEFPILASKLLGQTLITPFIDFSMLANEGFDTVETFTSLGVGFSFSVLSVPVRVDVASSLSGADGDVVFYFSLGAR